MRIGMNRLLEFESKINVFKNIRMSNHVQAYAKFTSADFPESATIHFK